MEICDFNIMSRLILFSFKLENMRKAHYKKSSNLYYLRKDNYFIGKYDKNSEIFNPKKDG